MKEVCGLFLVLFMYFMLPIFSLAAWFHGVCLSFHENVILGLVSLLFSPLGFWTGVVDWFGHMNIAVEILKALHGG